MNLAIKGHPTRGNEIISLLEMLGGVNSYSLCGNEKYTYYTIDSGKEIKGGIYVFGDEELSIFTLEEFLEKFPYKVGGKVKYVKYNDEYPSVYTIQEMLWTGVTIEYLLDSSGFSALTKDLQPYKEETVENKSNLLQQLKEYFDSTPREVVEKEWHQYDKYNEIGPKVNEYLEYVNNIRQPKYPKTYEECHKLMVQWKECDCNPNSELILCDAPINDFCKLIVARNIYWKIVGDEMGLDKPWKPDWKDDSDKYFICYLKDKLWMSNIRDCNRLLVFPTEEMRDAFYENFKELIEACKELL